MTGYRSNRFNNDFVTLLSAWRTTGSVCVCI
jgi:hypothetical protein